MPRPKHLVLCGGVEERKVKLSPLKLDLHGAAPNVHLRISDISRPLLMSIPDVLVDLLEVASYVYAADAAIPRGGVVGAQMGERWRRDFRFVIPVRVPDLWSSTAVNAALVETLSFLSDERYEFEFRLLVDPPAMATYFEFPDSEGSVFTPDELILFSGGIDSFAGAVEELVIPGRKIALVSHRSATKIAGAQRHLVDQLRHRFGSNCLLHIPVWAQLDGNLGREPTHRTRSFLFAALGAVTARLFGKERIRIFENGVVSLNLPPVAQVVGARATRTTHPQALAGFRRVLSELLDHAFQVENPFGWLTKTEVVERIAANGCGDLLRHTRSCTRVHEMTRFHPHCGRCSQCLDRRFAVLAAGHANEDPEEAYKVDLFTGERPPGPDREMALSFVRSASRIKQMADVAFFAHYGESSRIVGCFDEPADRVAERILDLYRRHADHVCRVFDRAISAHASELRDGSLPSDCLLSLVIAQHDASSRDVARTSEPEQVAVDKAEIRIAVDEGGDRVVFDRWGEITGANARLLLILAASHREAVRNECTPENFPFVRPDSLCQQAECDGETLRKRVFRCRKRIARMASEAGDGHPAAEAIIENSQWHGYRLNPDRIRIVALSELSAERTGHASHANRSRFATGG